MNPINAYVPNLPARTDRLQSIREQFMGRKEFCLHVVSPIQHEVPAYSLWKTFVECVRKEKENNSEYFLFCEDDHVFTADYSWETLSKRIAEARALGADILSGGVGWYAEPLQVRSNLFWLDKFNAMQFTIIFSGFYDKILATAKDSDGFILDWKLSEMSEQIYCIYPVISKQKEFGYSDLSEQNGKEGFLSKAFEGVSYRLFLLNKVRNHFLRIPKYNVSQDAIPQDIQIPTYIINLPDRIDRKQHMQKEFENRKEFDIHFFPAIRTKRGADGLWQSIYSIVKTASENNSDVIIICEDDHIFTADYNRENFLQDVIEAGQQGCQLLLGGVANFNTLVPVSARRWWLSWSWSTQFMVLFKSSFKEILSSHFGENDAADIFLSEILTHKQVLWPFVSVQKEFGYSDVTDTNNTPGFVTSHFQKSINRLYHLNQQRHRGAIAN